MNVTQLTPRGHPRCSAQAGRQHVHQISNSVPSLRQPSRSVAFSRPQQVVSRGRLQIVAGEKQNSSSVTKRRLTGGTGLPPIDGNDDGGGGGGGDGWNWERTARNVLPNLVFLGMYFMITSYGGDGWGGGFFGGGGGSGGGGGGDGHFGGSSQPQGGSSLRDNADNAERGDADESSSEEDSSEEGAAPVYNYRNRQQYRQR